MEDARIVERVTEKIKRSKEISESDKQLILGFADECYARGLTHNRVSHYLYRLAVLSSRFAEKDLKGMTTEDTKCLVGKIERSNYSEYTKQAYKVVVKKFFQWVGGYDWNSREYPENVKWIRTTVKKRRNKRPRILTREEVSRLIEAATTVQDKALISVLYESGCRIGEVVGMKLGDVDFRCNEAKIVVKGKTGCRGVLLISSIPHLANWVAHHPNRDNAESPLWLNRVGKILIPQTLRKRLVKFARIAGIDKPVNPHNIRKTRATHLANKLTEAQMCKYFGWVQGSSMPSHYVFLSGRDVDNAIRRIHGRLSRDQEKEQHELEPMKCPRCDHRNSAEANICVKCGLALDAKTAIEMDEKRKEFVRGTITPEIIDKMVEEKVKEKLNQILHASAF